MNRKKRRTHAANTAWIVFISVENGSSQELRDTVFDSAFQGYLLDRNAQLNL
jgi:hypothetical protein